MAITPGYEYDIFISYAHVDNSKFPGQDEGWIQLFFQNLTIMLDKRYGRSGEIKIWWDARNLDGNVVFDNSIEEGIKKSAIMICLNSPGYIQSDYCKQELASFKNKATTESIGLTIDNRSRIVNVLLNNIPFEEWPEGLSGTSGFPFHDSQEKDLFGNTLEVSSIEFRKQMQTLRDAIWQLLVKFPKEGTTTVAESKEEIDKNTFKIYLGEVADTLRTQRKRVIYELEKKGFKVLEGVPPPFDAQSHKAKVSEAIASSNLAVHLLDNIPGREIDGEPEDWYSSKQAQITLESDKPQLIWLPSDTDISTIDDLNYKQFLEELESGKASDKAYEFIRSSKSTIAREIIAYAEQLKSKKKNDYVESENLKVLLDTHFNDQLHALNLSKMLLENHIQPYINPQEDDPRKNINLLGDRMSQVKKLIFIYGNVSKEWLMERMSAALQLIVTNDYPIEDFYVYMAPPVKNDTDLLINQKFLKVNIVNSSKDVVINKGVLDQFLIDLKAQSL